MKRDFLRRFIPWLWMSVYRRATEGTAVIHSESRERRPSSSPRSAKRSRTPSNIAYSACPGIVRLRVKNADDALHVSIEDDGRWKQAQKRDERGRGLPLMRALMDGVEIRTNQFHTAIHLTMSWNG